MELLPANLKFKSIMVDPVEVRAVLDKEAAAGRLSAGETAASLHIARQGIQHLIDNRDEDGCPFLTAEIETNSKGTERTFFKPEEIQRFSSKYISTAELVTVLGTSAKAVGKELRSLGIEPILSREKLGAYLYRRSEFRQKMPYQIYGVLQ